MVYLFIKILISLQDIHESESEVAQSCPTLCDPWTVAHQAPLSMGFSRKEYWSGLPFPSPGDLPNPGIESGSPTLQADALTSDPPGKKHIYFCFIDYAKAFDCVDHNKLWKTLQEMGISDHLTCLLRNLYAGQEATARTGQGTTTGSKLGKAVYCHSAYLTSMQS